MKIPIANLYYLLLYAWDRLEQRDPAVAGHHGTTTIVDLVALVLQHGVNTLLHRRMDRGYVEVREVGSVLRGRLDVMKTMRTNSLAQARLHFQAPTLTSDILPNQILKATLLALLRVKDLSPDVKSGVASAYARFHEVTYVSVTPALFRRVHLHGNNREYAFLMDVCRLFWAMAVVDETTGDILFSDFVRDESKMSLLFQAFVRNFYAREQRRYRVNARRIQWRDLEVADDLASFLPQMHTDMTLESDERLLIVDTKYKSDAFQEHYGARKLRSADLYQIFTYVMNAEAGDREVSGMLLYPSVQLQTDVSFAVKGVQLRSVSVDLAQPWPEIHRQLISFLP